MEFGQKSTKEQIAEEYKDLPRRKAATPGKVVPEKKANMPYFVHQDWKAKQAKLAKEKEERQRIRAEKIAKGEDPGPDPDAPSIGVGSFFKKLMTLVLCVLAAGYFITGDALWGYRHEYMSLKFWQSLIPDPNMTVFTESQLAKYDGTDPEKPIYLAINGDVYDVTVGRHTYGPGGSYHIFAGKDAARAFVTGCFLIHQTHDIRGFGEKEMKSLKHWQDFYRKHEKYKKVGTVYHKPIHPSTPIPPRCKPDGSPVDSETKETGPQYSSAAPSSVTQSSETSKSTANSKQEL
ncbi:hypothetical protein FRC03_012434 [Tulasnella sp. 419]|nr:hypothetical protein FRC03_012434 [Tulasnella sp. 419]